MLTLLFIPLRNCHISLLLFVSSISIDTSSRQTKLPRARTSAHLRNSHSTLCDRARPKYVPFFSNLWL